MKIIKTIDVPPEYRQSSREIWKGLGYPSATLAHTVRICEEGIECIGESISGDTKTLSFPFAPLDRPGVLDGLSSSPIRPVYYNVKISNRSYDVWGECRIKYQN